MTTLAIAESQPDTIGLVAGESAPAQSKNQMRGRIMRHYGCSAPQALHKMREFETDRRAWRKEMDARRLEDGYDLSLEAWLMGKRPLGLTQNRSTLKHGWRVAS